MAVLDDEGAAARGGVQHEHAHHVPEQLAWNIGGTYGQLGTTYDDRGARGGPAVRQDPYIAPWAGINGDDRKALVPYLWVNYFKGDAGHTSG